MCLEGRISLTILMCLLAFTGYLPSQIGDLKDLKYLVIRDNLFNSTHTYELQVNDNQIDRTFPSQLGKLTSLMHLDIGGNQFQGTLPSEIGDLVGLQYLYVMSNQFTGTFPSWIGDLKDLRHLLINNNQFNGIISLNHLNHNLLLREFQGIG